jgi:hypothetical protein
VLNAISPIRRGIKCCGGIVAETARCIQNSINMAKPVKTSWASVLLMLCFGLRQDVIAQDNNSIKLQAPVTSKDGSFTLSREPIAVLLEAVSPNGRLVGISRVPADQQEATIHVHSAARVTGVYVDSAGKP